MKRPRTFARPLPGCLCLPAVGFTCSIHRDNPQAQSIEEADALADECAELCADLAPNVRTCSEHCPWNPDTLPDRLKGFGHRGADQDGYNGEWITPEEDHAEQMIEAARVLLDAVEI